MTPDSDSYDQMDRLRISDEVVDQMLSGRMAPAEAPDVCRDLAGLFQAAIGPTQPGELAGRDVLVAAAAASVLSQVPALTEARSRRKTMLSKLLTAKFAAAAAVAAIGMGTAAAAATGSLPGQTDNTPSQAQNGLTTANSHVGANSSTKGHSNHSVTPGVVQSSGQANSHAQYGLCQAFLNATTTTTTPASTPPQYSAPPFKALITEHKGIAATTTYCQGLSKPSDNAQSNSADQSGKPDTAKPANAGTPPVSTGKPTNAGQPSVSTGNAPVPTPNSGGTGTASKASGGKSDTGTSTASTASGGASSAGSANSGTTHP
jgi:hypothetical protein